MAYVSLKFLLVKGVVLKDSPLEGIIEHLYLY